jgi:hypothetical protein
MPPIFGTKKSLETQWKSVYKKRNPKRGTSELFKKLDVALQAKGYDRKVFVQTHLGDNAESDAKRFVKGIGDAVIAIDKQYKKFPDWTDKEHKFLKQLLTELEAEHRFWQKQYLQSKK